MDIRRVTTEVEIKKCPRLSSSGVGACRFWGWSALRGMPTLISPPGVGIFSCRFALSRACDLLHTACYIEKQKEQPMVLPCVLARSHLSTTPPRLRPAASLTVTVEGRMESIEQERPLAESPTAGINRHGHHPRPPGRGSGALTKFKGSMRV